MSTLTIRDRINGPEFRDQIAKVLPKHITPERMARAAATALMRTPLLAECDQASFFQAMMLLSQHGLEPDGRNAHLIPFKNNKKGIVECQLIIDYKGMVELIQRSGLVSTIHADKVCENDRFVVDCGEVVSHEINYREPRGDAYAYYCIIKKRDGSKKCEVMTKQEVDEIRKRSRSSNNGPWVTDYHEMAKKTVFKRASKWVSVSSEIRDIIAADDLQYENRPTSRASVVLSQALAPAIEDKQQEQPGVALIERYRQRLEQCSDSDDLLAFREIVAAEAGLDPQDRDELLMDIDAAVGK